MLSPSSTVLELGCGISGILPLALSRRVGRFIATDQEYVFKLLRSNLKENHATGPKLKVNLKRPLTNSKFQSDFDATSQSNIEILTLDWETSSISSLPDLLGPKSSSTSREIDAVLACDCIYNEALIGPFVQTCVDICKLAKSDLAAASPTICIVAQQLRSHDVFEAWLLAFHERFRVWRVPDHLLDIGLREGSGYVIHVATLREMAG